MGVERNNGRLCTSVDEHLQSPDDDVEHIQYLVDANVQQSPLAIQHSKHRYVLLERLLYLCEQRGDVDVERNNGRLCTSVDEHLQSPDDDVKHIQYLVDANIQQSPLAIEHPKHGYVLLERLLYLCEQYIDVDVERDNGRLCASVDEHLQSPNDDVEYIQYVVITDL
jgi:hypothetical protein